MLQPAWNVFVDFSKMALAVLSKFNKNNLTSTRWAQTMILLAVIEPKECGTIDYQKILFRKNWTICDGFEYQVKLDLWEVFKEKL